MTYFELHEFDCSETGENNMNPSFLVALDRLRGRCGFAFVITSGYRSEQHSVEKRKDKPGTHTQGIAADIAVSNGTQRRKLVAEALQMNFTGIGVAKEFVHVDMRSAPAVMWTY